MTLFFANEGEAADWVLDEFRPANRERVVGFAMLPIDTIERLEEAEIWLEVAWWHQVAADTAACPAAFPTYYERN